MYFESCEISQKRKKLNIKVSYNNFYMTNSFNPFAPELPVTARVDPLPFYRL